MPPWPLNTALGAFSTGVFLPSCVTIQIGPTFSVTIIRPSGRKARRQGEVKVATWVMVKGRLASGFCAPRLVWAKAAVPAAVVASKAAARAIFIDVISVSLKPPFPWRPCVCARRAHGRG